ncbi:fimbrial protein [Vibrio alginolyticus]
MFFLRKSGFILVLLFGFLIALNEAGAACVAGSNQHVNIHLSNFNFKNTIPSDWSSPIKLINSYEGYSGNRVDVTCTEPNRFTISHKLSNSFGFWGDIYNGNGHDGIAKTRVNGIGVFFQINRMNSSGVYNWLSIPSNFINGQLSPLYDSNGNEIVRTQVVNVSTNVRFGLVKYGPIPDSFVLSGSDMPCLVNSVGHKSDRVVISQHCFTGTIAFNSGTCDFDSSTIKLDDVSTRELVQNGFSEWMNSNISLINCSGFYGLNGLNNYAEIKITPLNDGDYSNGILNVDNNSDSAKGVALQIKDSNNNKFLDFNKEITLKAKLNNNISENIDIPLRVRYIKTSSVSPGNVRASMMVMINYK